MFFIISSIILSIQLKKSKMFIANSFYIFSFVILLCIFSFTSNAKFITDIIKLFVSEEDYQLLYSSFTNVDCLFSYLYMLSLITISQMYVSYRIIHKHIKKQISKITKVYKRIKREIKQIYNKYKIDKNHSLDRVFIDYCRMIN